MIAGAGGGPTDEAGGSGELPQPSLEEKLAQAVEEITHMRRHIDELEEEKETAGPTKGKEPKWGRPPPPPNNQ